MFIDRLSPPEQRAFLSVAARLIAVDGVDASETAALASAAAVAGVGPAWRPEAEASTEALLARFDSGPARRAVLLELLGIAHADTTYSPEERDFIAAAARTMGVSEVEVALMEGWVIRQLSLAHEAEQLLRRG